MLILEREPFNRADKNAVKLMSTNGFHIGYLNRNITSQMAPVLDSGLKFLCTIKNLTGLDKDIRGVNLEIRKIKPMEIN